MLYVVVQVDQERFAIDVMRVEEVIPFVHVTPLSGAPPGVAGIIDYHGAPVPVIDLASTIAGTPTIASLSARIVVVRHESPGDKERLTGLLVPRAGEVLRCDPGAFVPAALGGRDTRHHWDVFPDAQGIVQRLDLRTLLTLDARRTAPRVEDAA